MVLNVVFIKVLKIKKWSQMRQQKNLGTAFAELNRGLFGSRVDYFCTATLTRANDGWRLNNKVASGNKQRRAKVVKIMGQL
jgi:hypothetical protein